MYLSPVDLSFQTFRPSNLLETCFKDLVIASSLSKGIHLIDHYLCM
jgi:hypothetical protein